MNERDTERRLVDSCVGHDKRGWDRLVEEYGSVIYATVLRTFNAYRRHTPRQDVEDAAQDVFVRLVKDDFRLLGKYDPSRASLATWLSIVARSTALNFLNRLRPPAQELDENVLGIPAPAPPDCEPVDIPEGLLSPRQQLVLRMLFDDERPVPEVAAALGITAQSVRSLKHKALEKLRAHFNSRQPPAGKTGAV